MAKTKKEMRKAQANYADIILRKNKYIKELQEKLQAWEQVNKINQTVTAAVLLIYGATDKDKSVEVKRTTINEMFKGFDVLAEPTEDGTRLWLQQKAGE